MVWAPDSSRLKHRLWRIAKHIALAFGLVSLLLTIVFAVSPVGFRNLVFTPGRELSYFVTELDLFSNWGQITKIETSVPQVIHIPGDN